MPICFDTLYKLHQKKFFWCNLKPIESLNNDSDDGSENVAAVFFNAGDLGGGVEFLRTLSSFKKRIENSSSYGYILQETSH